MAGLGLKDLPLPPKRYDLARTARFETESAAAHEDQVGRSTALQETAFAGGKLINRANALDLARRLAGKAIPETLASSRHMRELRRRVHGHTLQLHDALDKHGGRTFHLVGEGHSKLPGNLMDVSAPLLRNAFRSDINRSMPTLRIMKAPSGLIGFLHGEFNEDTERFSIHMHGYAFGAHLDAVNALPKLPKYKPGKAGDGRDAIAQPKLVRKELGDPAYTLSYNLKSYWPGVRTIYELDDKIGVPKRSVQTRRIPEPYHSLSLLWLDRWALGDISLLMGLRVTKRGISLNLANGCTRMG